MSQQAICIVKLTERNIISIPKIATIIVSIIFFPYRKNQIVNTITSKHTDNKSHTDLYPVYIGHP